MTHVSRRSTAALLLIGAALVHACSDALPSAPGLNDLDARGADARASVEIINLGTLGGNGSIAVGINDQGQVIGYSRDASNAYKPFVWENGVMRALPTLGGPCATNAFACAALGINERGDVVGRTVAPDGMMHATLWRHTGEMVDLGVPAGWSSSSASGINERGQIVGFVATAAGRQHAALWDDGVFEDLGTLGGANSVAGKINALGQVAGVSQDVGGVSHVFRWSRTTGMVDLGANAPWGFGCVARGINNQGEVTTCRLSANGVRGTIWSLERDAVQVRDLATLGAGVSNVWQINEVGEAVGNGSRIVNGQCCFGAVAVVWSARGEPTVLGSLGGNSIAFAINNRGDIVGESFLSPASIAIGDRATLWRRKR